MMEVTARTPGKLVLLGDYAVLEGAPALAMAVNRHAKVRIAARPGGVAAVSAPDMQVSGVPLKIDEQGAPQWLGTAEQAQALRLVDETLRGLQHEGLAPAPGRGFDLHLDTSGYFDQGAQGRAKLGLGSSAALTVALASAMTVFVGRGPAIANRRVWLEHLLALHRQFQGGHGSGVDVATSLIGGVISYRLLEGGTQPRAEPVGWPKGVHLRFVWSGRSASTSDFLGRLAQWRTQPLPDGATLVAFSDITATRQLETAIEARDEALNESVRLKRDFVANVSYELRTPLTTIVGYADLLQAQTNENPKQKAYLDSIQSAAQELARSIDDVLDMAQIDAGEMSIHREDVRLLDIVAEVGLRLSDAFKARGVGFDYSGVIESGLIRVDAKRLAQCLEHLLGNAIRNASSGGAVALNAQKDGDNLVLEVAYTGRGIPYHVQAHIFDRYIGRERGGPGLGLALVKALVELHDGWITLESEPNEGASFKIHLPGQNQAGRSDAGPKLELVETHKTEATGDDHEAGGDTVVDVA